MKSSVVYGTRSSGGEHGTVMTRHEVIEFMLDAAGYTPDKNLSKLNVLDPAGGDGRFIVHCMHRLAKSSQKFKFNLSEAMKNLKIVELDTEKVELIKETFLREMKEIPGLKNSEKTIKEMVFHHDFLTLPLGRFDLVIGNPPYVRHENIPDSMKKIYREKFKHFRHRSDLYVAFFDRGLQLLRPNGQLCFICSNRYMRNKYGESLRNHIARSHSVPVIVDVEEADAFEEAVNAYASIILIKNQREKTPLEYFKIEQVRTLPRVLDTLRGKDVGKDFAHLSLPPLEDSAWVFDLSYARVLGNGFGGIEDQGYKIGIGVATGADKIFVSRDLPKQVEEEVLLPILLSKDIHKGKITWGGNYVLNPYTPSGQLIDLKRYPKAKAYFEQHSHLLKKRHVAKNRPVQWYKTIDRIYPELTKRKKLILPDMTSDKLIVLEKGKYYPHHNLYYITNENEEDLKVLACFLMSDFVMWQLKLLSTLMNGGFVRWQSQNLRKLRIPRLEDLPPSTRKELVYCFDHQDLPAINSLVKECVKQALIAKSRPMSKEKERSLLDFAHV